MEIKVLDFKQINNLGVLQFATKELDTFNYLTLPKAIEKEYVQVKEVSEGGEVNNLLVVNNSKHYVFIMDGEILEGAKQNRVVNTSILMAPSSKNILPVSCVERGRWSHKSQFFKTADYHMPSSSRSRKSHKVKQNLEENNEYMAEQGAVWEDVMNVSTFFKVKSKTDNLSDVYFQLQEDFEKNLKNFEINDMANGVSFFIGKEMISIELFNRRDVLQEHFNKLLTAVQFDVDIAKKIDHLTFDAASFKIVDTIDKISDLEKQEYDSIGVGTDLRFENKVLHGFQLFYKNHTIHLSSQKK
ncbi:MAG: hypothetical protein K9G44_14320 [Melioribacteraceae bacterium]|nr:hypothetical protein [Melioribacteraceae bacterium]